VATDDRRDFRVAGLLDRRKKRLLADPTCTDDCITYLLHLRSQLRKQELPPTTREGIARVSRDLYRLSALPAFRGRVGELLCLQSIEAAWARLAVARFDRVDERVEFICVRRAVSLEEKVLDRLGLVAGLVEHLDRRVVDVSRVDHGLRTMHFHALVIA